MWPFGVRGYPRSMAIRSGPPHVGRCLLIAVAVAVAAVGCASESPDAGPTADDTVAKRTSTTTTSSTTTTTEDATTTTTTAPKPTPKEEVEAAYLAISAEYFKRLTAPDPSDSSISRNHVGESRASVEKELSSLDRAGQVGEFAAQGAPKPRLVSTAVEGSEAAVRFCLIDDTRIIERSSKTVINDKVSSRLGRAVLTKTAGHWQLERQDLLRRWEDGKGCR